MSDPNQFLLYTAPDGAVKIEVALKDETVWLTQKALAELFGVQVPKPPIPQITEAQRCTL